ncbi:hypothetical protein AKJ38_03090 [candidate division MSBL1 archaeon SCGC-AAA259I14]|uniref:Uncharacterized protein n=1 Tax=candidate division MSBL1 archaeon SCGC-AAA259I14 TaxID=1698268 RepID=A0A133UQN9_9EURY|nr:hypothetical protein AKJ38_03090 [candidate division MSBL1 archaeon SCGC-AAA259I14]
MRFSKEEMVKMTDLYLNLAGFQKLVGSELRLQLIVAASLCVILLAVLNRSSLTEKIRGD